MPIEVHAVAEQGWRPSMEDRHVLTVVGDRVDGAIFDGHGGPAVAVLGARRYGAALEGATPGLALRRLHEEARGLRGGACAVAFRLQGNRLQVANVGDAGLAVFSGSGTARILTRAHRLDDPEERQRVLASGALIDGPYVIDPSTGEGLMPTRAIGDAEFERVGVSAEPFELTTTFAEGWLVAACDGLWDVLEPGDLWRHLAAASSAADAAAALAGEALGVRGSTDNVTVIVVRKSVAAGQRTARRGMRSARSMRSSSRHSASLLQTWSSSSSSWLGRSERRSPADRRCLALGLPASLGVGFILAASLLSRM